MNSPMLTNDRYIQWKPPSQGVHFLLGRKDGQILQVPARWDEAGQVFRSVAFGSEGQIMAQYPAEVAVKLQKLGYVGVVAISQPQLNVS